MSADVALRAENLTKRYGDLTAVNGLSLEVFDGEVLGFLGPNGAGKTTSINMLCGLVRPDSGRIIVRGRAVTGGAAAARSGVGVCPQSIVLWGSLTCLEQLEFIGEMYGVPRATARRRGGELLDAMGLSGKRDRIARTLSGGMQRRLNLIMALVHDPDILILDEPEAGLDPQGRVLVREYLLSLARRKTIILTTHNMDEAERVAARVVIIDRGRVLATGTPEELKRRLGQGDVLEFDIPPGSEAAAARSAHALAPPAIATVSQGLLTVRLRGVVEALPGILETLREAGFRPGGMRLRETSLEDVFISLTGRGLRE